MITELVSSIVQSFAYDGTRKSGYINDHISNTNDKKILVYPEGTG